MAKKNGMNAGLLFNTAALLSKGNPEAFMAIVKCFVHASQPDAPPWAQHTHQNDPHTTKATLLTRHHK